MSTAAQLQPILTEKECTRLAECEAVIEHGIRIFYYDVGSALAEIRDSRLYRASHATFEEYCRERWGMVASRARQLIGAAEVIANLESVTTVTPSSERQARELVPLPPEQQREVWQTVLMSDVQPTASVIRAVRAGRSILTVRNCRGNSEYYAPENIVEAVRDVMGSIDLDPASCALANTVVRATRFYEKTDDGLSLPWLGTVWLNPPFSDWDKWAGKLLAVLPQLNETCALVGAFSLSTAYFMPLLRRAGMICVLSGRLEFWGPSVDAGNGNGAAMGHVIAYFGDRTQEFAERFNDLGVCLSPVSPLRRCLAFDAP